MKKNTIKHNHTRKSKAKKKNMKKNMKLKNISGGDITEGLDYDTTFSKVEPLFNADISSENSREDLIKKEMLPNMQSVVYKIDELIENMDKGKGKELTQMHIIREIIITEITFIYTIFFTIITLSTSNCKDALLSILIPIFKIHTIFETLCISLDVEHLTANDIIDKIINFLNNIIDNRSLITYYLISNFLTATYFKDKTFDGETIKTNMGITYSLPKNLKILLSSYKMLNLNMTTAILSVILQRFLKYPLLIKNLIEVNFDKKKELEIILERLVERLVEIIKKYNDNTHCLSLDLKRLCEDKDKDTLAILETAEYIFKSCSIIDFKITTNFFKKLYEELHNYKSRTKFKKPLHRFASFVRYTMNKGKPLSRNISEKRVDSGLHNYTSKPSPNQNLNHSNIARTKAKNSNIFSV